MLHCLYMENWTRSNYYSKTVSSSIYSLKGDDLTRSCTHIVNDNQYPILLRD